MRNLKYNKSSCKKSPDKMYTCKKFYILFFTAAIFLLSCSNYHEQIGGRKISGKHDNKQTGTVNVGVTSAESRSILPSAVNIEDLDIKIILTSALHGEIITPQQPYNASGYTIPNVLTGSWDIIVEGIAAGNSIPSFRGSSNLDVTTGTNAVSIVLKALQEGNGSFYFSLSWPTVSADSAEVNWTDNISDIPGTTPPFTPAINSGSLYIGLSSIASGNYYITVILSKGGYEVCRVIEVVRIYDGMASTGDISLTSTDFGTPPVSPGTPSILTLRDSEKNLTGTSVTWTDNSYTEEGFRVLRLISPMTDPELLANLPAGTTNFVDTDISSFTSGASVEYRIAAYNSHGESAGSADSVLFYALSYNGNGSTSGLLPQTDPVLYIAGESYNVKDNTENLRGPWVIDAAAGITRRFLGWQTQSDGGDERVPGITYTMTEPGAALYAKWMPIAASPHEVIGQIGPAGGYVFYDKGSNDDGWRYIEAAVNDLTASVWIQGGTTQTTSNNFTDEINGKINTLMIISQSGHTSSAAKNCSDYIIEGFNDWFLPSKNQLSQMYTTLKLNDIGDFTSDIYWSSTEKDPMKVWTINFNNGIEDNAMKNQLMKIRPVRVFSGNNAVYMVAYRTNDSTSGTIESFSMNYQSGASINVLSNSYGLQKDGFVFNGWNTKADGTGINYPAGTADAFIMPSDNVILYADWKPLVIHVSASTGSDISGSGSTIAPYATITKAVTELTGLAGKKTIKVAKGTYTGNIDLSVIPDTKLLGGFTTDFSDRVWKLPSDRQNPLYAAILNITSGTTTLTMGERNHVEGFTINNSSSEAKPIGVKIIKGWAVLLDNTINSGGTGNSSGVVIDETFSSGEVYIGHNIINGGAGTPSTAMVIVSDNVSNLVVFSNMIKGGTSSTNSIGVDFGTGGNSNSYNWYLFNNTIEISSGSDSRIGINLGAVGTKLNLYNNLINITGGAALNKSINSEVIGSVAGNFFRVDGIDNGYTEYTGNSNIYQNGTGVPGLNLNTAGVPGTLTHTAVRAGGFGLENEVNSIFVPSEIWELVNLMKQDIGGVNRMSIDISGTSWGWSRGAWQYQHLFAGGIGINGAAYQINTEAELDLVRQFTGAGNAMTHFTLNADIDIAGNPNWLPIGDNTSPFTGNFDGSNKKIINLTINQNTMRRGLFGEVQGAVIKNLTLENVSIIGGSNFGALAGWVSGTDKTTEITNCSVTGNIVSNSGNTGGLIGIVNDTTGGTVLLITESSAEITINSTNNEGFGGLVGSVTNNTSVQIERSFAKGTFILSETNGSSSGGLVGIVWSAANPSAITNSYAMVSISGYQQLGGLVGHTNNTTITNSFAAGLITGGDNSMNRGLFYNITGSSALGCFYDNEVNPLPYGWDTNSTAGKSTADLKSQSTFTGAGWDFATVWSINEGSSYPYLKWEP